LVKTYKTIQEIIYLDVIKRKHDSLENQLIHNTQNILKKFREILTYKAKILNSYGYSVTKDQVNEALYLIMNLYFQYDRNWENMENNSKELDPYITQVMGAYFIKRVKSERERSWWEYIPGIYVTEATFDLLSGGVKKNEPMSWINDILGE
jgi:hypothetical protein